MSIFTPRKVIRVLGQLTLLVLFTYTAGTLGGVRATYEQKVLKAHVIYDVLNICSFHRLQKSIWHCGEDSECQPYRNTQPLHLTTSNMGQNDKCFINLVFLAVLPYLGYLSSWPHRGRLGSLDSRVAPIYHH